LQASELSKLTRAFHVQHTGFDADVEIAFGRPGIAMTIVRAPSVSKISVAGIKVGAGAVDSYF